MKNLFFDARHLHSGIGTYILGLLDHYHQETLPFAMTLIGSPSRLAPRYPKFDLIPCEIPIYSISEQLRLPALFKGADLLHVPHFNVPLAYRGNFVTTIHDTAHYALPELARTLPRKLYRNLIFAHIRRHAQQILTVSQFSKSEIVKYTGCASEKITVIPNGVLNIFCGDTQIDALRNSTLRHAIGEAPYLLYVGNFKRHKNIPRMIAAFRRFKQLTALPHKLVMVGEEDADISPLAAGDDDICVLSDCSTEQLVAVYHDAEALLQVSLYEGFGLTPLEAMARSVPVLVSEIPSLREVVADAGLFADPLDVGDMATQMARICQDSALRERLVRNGYARVEQFCWSTAAETTIAVYESLLYGSARSISARAFFS